jgi:hypothetical protein
MKKPVRHLLYWSPRILGVLMVAYAAKNVADFVKPGMGFWDASIAVLSHLIPSFLLAVVVWLSWRREWIAGSVFVLLATLRFAKDVIRSDFGHLWLTLLALSIGALWFVSWKYRSEIRRPGTF